MVVQGHEIQRRFRRAGFQPRRKGAYTCGALAPEAKPFDRLSSHLESLMSRARRSNVERDLVGDFDRYWLRRAELPRT